MAGIASLLAPDIQILIRERQWEVVRDALARLDPSDVAEILVRVPDEDDVAIFRILPRDRAAQVFAYLPRDHQEGLLRSLTNDQMRTILAALNPDDPARWPGGLRAGAPRRIPEALPPDGRRAARALLGSPLQSVGRYMPPRYVALRPNMTAAEALDFIRRAGRDQETLSVLYV